MLNDFAERIVSACAGFDDLKTNGKLLAVFGILLIGLVLNRRQLTGRGRCLTCYAAVVSLLCLFPVTAALLMTYQTPFYDYCQIWAAVPVTAVCAYAGVRGDERLNELGRRKAFCAGIAICAAVFLCSGMGRDPWGREQESADYAEARTVLTELREALQGQSIVLWAPEELLQYARALDGSVQLLYGRNMTDNALNAYAYDTVSEELAELHRWMDEEPADTREETESHVGQAFALGANCVLLDGDISEEELTELNGHTEWTVMRMDGYVLICNAEVKL